MKAIRIGEPYRERFTKDSITWLNTTVLAELDVENWDQVIEITFDNNKIRKYGYFDGRNLKNISNLNLNCTFVDELSIVDQELSISTSFSYLFGSTCFEDCRFTNDKIDIFNCIVDGSIIFRDMELSQRRIYFKYGYAEYIIFKNCTLRCHISFKLCQLKNIIINGCTIFSTVNMDVIDYTRLNSLNLYKTRILGQVFLDWSDGLVKSIFRGSRVEFSKEQSFKLKEIDYRDIAKQFVLLKENYRNLGQYDDEDSAYVYYKRCDALANFYDSKKGSSLECCAGYIIYVWDRIVYDRIGGYGTNPKNVFRTIVITWGAFALCYALIPGGIADNFIYIESIPNWAQRALSGIYFSVITFVTVGYGDISPANHITSFLAMFEGFLGVFLMSYFTVSFVRKLLR